MSTTVNVRIHKETFDFLIFLNSDRMRLTCTLSLVNDTKSLEIFFLKIPGLTRCSFNMGSEDMDTFLLSKSYASIDKRASDSIVNRKENICEINFPNAIIYLAYNEAIEFYEMVDLLNYEIKSISAIKNTRTRRET